VSVELLKKEDPERLLMRSGRSAVNFDVAFRLR
jgi:hypothetical protein